MSRDRVIRNCDRCNKEDSISCITGLCPNCEKKDKEKWNRIEELEETAKRNREKWDDTPLKEWLDGEEEEEYTKLIKELE